MNRLTATLSAALLLLVAASYAQDATVTLNNGDVNNDGYVNSFDYPVIDVAFGSTPGSGNWNADADLNGDLQVNLADYTVADMHYGQTGAAALTGTTGTIGGQNYVTVRVNLSDWSGAAKTVDVRLKKQGTTTIYNYTINSGSNVVLAVPSSGTYDGTAISSHFLRATFTATSHADTTPPVPGTATCSARQLSGDIPVGYSGASDTQSGLKKVELWAKKGTGNWENTNVYSSSASGILTTPSNLTAGFVGTIYFDLVAEDNCGNRSSAASGLGDCSVLYGSASTCTFLQVVMPQ